MIFDHSIAFFPIRAGAWKHTRTCNEMKKIGIIVALMAMAIGAQAQEPAEAEKSSVSLAYDAGFDVVTAYIWRGIYNGGLSFQPNLAIGFETEHTEFKFGAWASLGASDWKFQSGLDITEDGNPNTQFMPELDLNLAYTFYGATIGFNHYYYFRGSNFFTWQSVEEIEASENNTSQTDILVGYNFDDQLHVPLYINWSTVIAGCDINYNEDGSPKRAYSSYLELGYTHTFPYEISLDANIGMSPWESPLYGNEKFAVVCIGLKLNKEWEAGPCCIDLYAQGTINPNGINKDNAYINAAGDFKLYEQKLNGLVGLGIWF